MGRQGPAPLGEGLRGGPEGLYLLTNSPAQEQAAHSSKGPGHEHIRDRERSSCSEAGETRLSGQNYWGGGAHEGPTGQTLRSQEGAQSGASE